MVPFAHLRNGTYSAFGWLNFWKAWRLYGNVCGLLFLGTLFALVLSTMSAGTGAVFVADGPAVSDKIEYPGGVPTIRVPLGGKLEFDMAWHVVEGGCDRYMTRTFTRISADEPYTLSLRKRAPSHAVGRPGTEHVSVDLPAGIFPGLWLYTSDADAVCPQLGRKTQPVRFASIQVEVYDPDQPVMQALSRPELVTPLVKRGGPLQYKLSWRRNDPTLSEVYNTYSSLTPTASGLPDVVIERRPSLQRPPGEYSGVEISAPLPADVTAGKWRMRQVLISTRPGGRTRTDFMFELEFEVAK